jgi:drug/metabolite transporter (DMT)-like permease
MPPKDPLLVEATRKRRAILNPRELSELRVKPPRALRWMLGASAVGLVLSLPVALASGQFYLLRWPLNAADGAVVVNSVLHAFCYATYVWLVGRAGSTFAAQCSYLVTGFGVLWSIAILGERYSGWVWLALLLVLGGVFLVQPRDRPGLAVPVPAADNSAT